MPFSFKKGINVGPLRINLSKSGIGASFGVTGARVGIRPDGRTYHHVGRHGAYHRGEHGRLGADDEYPASRGPATQQALDEVSELTERLFSFWTEQEKATAAWVAIHEELGPYANAIDSCEEDVSEEVFNRFKKYMDAVKALAPNRQDGKAMVPVPYAEHYARYEELTDWAEECSSELGYAKRLLSKRHAYRDLIYLSDSATLELQALTKDCKRVISDFKQHMEADEKAQPEPPEEEEVIEAVFVSPEEEKASERAALNTPVTHEGKQYTIVKVASNGVLLRSTNGFSYTGVSAKEIAVPNERLAIDTKRKCKEWAEGVKAFKEKWG